MLFFFFSPQSVQINKILSNALEWGVKILFVDGTISPFFAAAATHQLLFMFWLSDATIDLFPFNFCRRCCGISEEEKEGMSALSSCHRYKNV